MRVVGRSSMKFSRPRNFKWVSAGGKTRAEIKPLKHSLYQRRRMQMKIKRDRGSFPLGYHMEVGAFLVDRRNIEQS